MNVFSTPWVGGSSIVNQTFPPVPSFSFPPSAYEAVTHNFQGFHSNALIPRLGSFWRSRIQTLRIGSMENQLSQLVDSMNNPEETTKDLAERVYAITDLNNGMAANECGIIDAPICRWQSNPRLYGAQWRALSRPERFSLLLEIWGYGLMFVGRHEDAISVYDEAITHTPKNYRLHHNRSLCLLELRRYEEACQSASLSIEAHSEFLSAYYLRARAHMGICQWTEAMLDLEHFMGNQPDDPIVNMAYGECLWRSGDRDNKMRAVEQICRTAASLIHDAQEKMADGQSQRAQMSCKLIIDGIGRLPELVISQDGDLCLYMAQAYHGLGDLKAAEVYYRKRIDMNPSNALAYYDFGVFLFNSSKEPGSSASNLRHAHHFLTKAIEINPEYPEFYVMRAAASVDLQNFEDALYDLTQAIRIEPHTDNYISRGSAYTRLNRYNEAVSDYLYAAANDLSNPLPYQGLSYVYFKMGNDPQAMIYAQRAIRSAKEAKDCCAIARILKLNGKNQEARLAYEKALVMKPDLKEALGALKSLDE